MKKMMMMTLSALAITLAVTTQASGNRLTEEGRFMQGPDVIECVVDVRYIECLYDGVQVRERVLLTDNTVLDLTTLRSTDCMNGICEDRYYGFIGRVPERFTDLRIPLYYYIWGERDGRPVAYKRGTGPARDQFPAWAVGNPNQQPTGLDNFIETNYGVINVTCTIESMARNECEVTAGDRQDVEAEWPSAYFSKEEILNNLGFAEIGEEERASFFPECYEGSCMTFRGYWMGLDPDFDFWQD